MGKISEKARIRLMNKRGMKCERCGLRVTFRSQLDIHHIEDPNDNDPANLELVCPSCHRDIHMGIQPRNPKFHWFTSDPKPVNES